MHTESQRGGETRNILMDIGFTPGALVNNVDLLGIDPAALDALVLSHGHYDHFGGVVGLLQAHNGKLKAGLPLYVGGEECFCSRVDGTAGARRLRRARPQGPGESGRCCGLR
jgi:7,8-dihydropterin-6-yl-methyl-4-(beta-D-ribofuranosyl)aminobenzene 5'-phosphate synthase